MYDVAIIGAGFIGLAAARELSRRKGNICVIECNEDVCVSELSDVIYAGYEIPSESIAAKPVIHGNELLSAAAEELHIPLEKKGAAVIRTKKTVQEAFDQLILQGEKNDVPGFKVYDSKELSEIKTPVVLNHTVKDIEEVIFAPTAGTADPYAFCASFAENAAENGVDFFFNTRVCDVAHGKGYYILKTSNETIRARAVINTVNGMGDIFHNSVSRQELHTTMLKSPVILDTVSASDASDSNGIDAAISSPLIFQFPPEQEKKKGLFDFLGTNHTPDTSDHAADPSAQEAVFGEALGAANYFDAYGFGEFAMTAAPAAAIALAEKISSSLALDEKTDFNPYIKEVTHPSRLSENKQAALIAENPAYEEKLCSESSITKGEVYDVILRAAAPVTAAGVLHRLGSTDANNSNAAAYRAVDKILNMELSQESSSQQEN